MEDDLRDRGTDTRPAFDGGRVVVGVVCNERMIVDDDKDLPEARVEEIRIDGGG